MAYARLRSRRSWTRRGRYGRTYSRATRYKRRLGVSTSRKRSGAPLRTGRMVRPKLSRFASVRARPQGRVAVHGDNATSSFVSVGGTRMLPSLRNLMRKLVQLRNATTTTSGFALSGIGRQNTINVTFLTKQQLTSMETAANNGIATDNSLRLFLKSGKVTLTLRNQTNNNAVVKLYDIVCKRDPPNEDLDSPVDAWAKGMTDFGVMDAEEVIAATPFRSPEFNHFFRVVRVTSLHMEPGMQHVHTVRHYYNKVYNSVRTQSVGGTAVSGFTRFIMPVFYGSLVHEDGAPDVVTTSNIKLDYSIVREHSWGFLLPAAPTVSVTDTLPKALTAPSFMADGDDVDAPIVAA